MIPDLSQAKLTRQSYGLAMSQVTYGGSRGIWLECKACPESQVIVGSRFKDDPYANITDGEAAAIFRRHGWTGEGDKMTSAMCPRCSRINDDTKVRVIVDGDCVGEMSLASFFETNRDGMSNNERALVRVTLDKLGIYHGGGGAAGEWSVELVK